MGCDAWWNPLPGECIHTTVGGTPLDISPPWIHCDLLSVPMQNTRRHEVCMQFAFWKPGSWVPLCSYGFGRDSPGYSLFSRSPRVFCSFMARPRHSARLSNEFRM